jgi:hypothetical protein
VVIPKLISSKPSGVPIHVGAMILQEIKFVESATEEYFGKRRFPPE